MRSAADRAPLGLCTINEYHLLRARSAWTPVEARRWRALRRLLEGDGARDRLLVPAPRRRYRRVLLELDAELLDWRGAFQVRVQDVSAGGFGILGGDLELNSYLDLLVRDECGALWRYPCRVAWAGTGRRYGVRLDGRPLRVEYWC